MHCIQYGITHQERRQRLSEILVEGLHRLRGEIRIQGSNAALP